MTIRDAAIQVLARADRAMGCREIADEIKARRLHQLPTQHPASVVNKAIRRHCVGVTTDGSRPKKYFKSLSDRRYALLSPRPQL